MVGRIARSSLDCDILSEGADTLSLWKGDSGRYYHARCHIRGAVDFVCPRGWCYMTDCSFYETKATAAVWHDGHLGKDMKFVLRNCRFDGVQDFNLARHHADAQFYFLDSRFSPTMRDLAPFRVIYPLGGAVATDADRKRNADLDKNNLWGERSYFYNCHGEKGDFPWHADNLASAPGAPKSEQITAAWTFAGTWDPEKTEGPSILSVSAPKDGRIEVLFSERVTVKGMPRLTFASGAVAEYAHGSGAAKLEFTVRGSISGKPVKLDASQGRIIASEAYATLRTVELK